MVWWGVDHRARSTVQVTERGMICGRATILSQVYQEQQCDLQKDNQSAAALVAKYKVKQLYSTFGAV